MADLPVSPSSDDFCFLCHLLRLPPRVGSVPQLGPAIEQIRQESIRQPRQAPTFPELRMGTDGIPDRSWCGSSGAHEDMCRPQA